MSQSTPNRSKNSLFVHISRQTSDIIGHSTPSQKTFNLSPKGPPSPPFPLKKSHNANKNKFSGEKPLSLFPTRGNNWARRKGLLRGRSDGKPIFESVLHDWLPLWAANWPWRRSPSSCFSPYWGSIDFLSIFSACGDPEHLTKLSPFGQTFHSAY